MTDPLGAQSGATDGGQSATGGTTGSGTDPATGAPSGAGSTGTDANAGALSGVSREDFDRLRTQLQAADQKRAEAEAQLRTIRDKDMPALEKAQRDLADLTTALSERDAVIQQLRVENAFLTDNSTAWHSAAAAMQLLDRSKITVGSDGTVVGMKDALTALAKAHPYLVKPEPAGTTPPAPAGPGTAPANGGIAPQAGQGPTNAELRRRFPALGQRLG